MSQGFYVFIYLTLSAFSIHFITHSTHSFVRSFIRSFARRFVRSFVRSFLRASVAGRDQVRALAAKQDVVMLVRLLYEHVSSKTNEREKQARIKAAHLSIMCGHFGLLD